MISVKRVESDCCCCCWVSKLLELRMVEMKMELELERQRKVDLPLELRLVTARIMAGCFFWRGGRGVELFFSKGRRGAREWD